MSDLLSDIMRCSCREQLSGTDPACKVCHGGYVIPLPRPDADGDIMMPGSLAPLRGPTRHIDHMSDLEPFVWKPKAELFDEHIKGMLAQPIHPAPLSDEQIARAIAKVGVDPHGLDLPGRLERQADNVERDGWLSAARIMREAAEALRDYREAERHRVDGRGDDQ
jgi:hypothetical protein